MRTNHSHAPIVDLASLSVLGNKSSSNPKALLMSLSVAPSAVELTKHGVPTVTATPTRHGIKSSAYLYPVSHIE